MLISKLLNSLPEALRPVPLENGTETRDCTLTGLVLDSRRSTEGCLFAALPTAAKGSMHAQGVDGRDFIPMALEKGAAAILTTSDSDTSLLPDTVPVLLHSNPRAVLSAMAAAFYDRQPETLIAITGTNGKTSVANFLQQLWSGMGLKAASLGTLGLIPPVLGDIAELTTPDTIGLHRTLQGLCEKGFDHLAIEASSHGLDQYRLDGLRLSAAGFTNLGRDHLDYHEDMNDYFAAKSRLFVPLLPEGKTAVLNLDSPEGRKLAELCQKTGRKVLGTGQGGEADLRLLSRKPTATGQDITLAWNGTSHDLHLPLAGAFQAENLLIALGLLLATGNPLEKILPLLERLEGVPGRMEGVGQTKDKASVYVDFAHTPDALETVLKALRPHCSNRLAVVVGCGGDRDPGKRPIMARVSADLAERVYITDDNPRTENPATIREQMVAGLPRDTKADCQVIDGRSLAITQAVNELEAGDCLVIAGKGHESGQIVGTRKLPFDDRDEARKALKAREEREETR
ncbi:UDP-N-acetylmuramoyl-L-alanyl-D-glutamate--2,6-diaminopimelate ligase [Kiloniella sp. b19]|uniref:UDP-N-acetylmuramoyl-L-alanyl-D-glutamate--2, 6-diaminopimelate ligase n=1 Tax=Kiloniella sp. GXU_MW_B19 TaxID=3141326 RepID=UPI0031E454C0